MFEKGDLSKRQYMNDYSFRFKAKFELVFIFTQENAFLERFHLKANRKGISSSKKAVLGISKMTLFLCNNH